MKQIKACLEVGKDGYGVSFEEIPNVFGFGETVDEAKADARNAIETFIAALTRCGQPVPEVLQEPYELVFEFDVEALLKHIDGIVTKTALAKVTGINVTQLCHYSSGLKKPRKEQRERIISGIRKLGNELLSVF
ncbi:MAG: type II toxin-antitoxin system HicB family antitoxin [Odoribacteraceae bacterium]|jgi:predicted RNase H-like HicB family nuclease|nr:type II toxin-antitoxin system HicB family antitoxin [Odoribacteraceae bacterium]